ncbi:condensation domain-containing protein, partial [Streptomyces sp. TR06-5]|uniref:condensation domain-containing protein n=1 Tax=unclassified Streptomyces TaxID=2593676 RepID=UPI0039A3898F
GVEQATPLSVERHVDPGAAPPGADGQDEVTLSFDAQDTARLQELAHAHRLTLNTVLQGCWALLLGRYAGTDDVVLGTVVSGRPSEVEGIERVVGLFINTLPVRVPLPEQSSSLDWLHALQEQNVQMRQYDYSPLRQVHQWSGLPAGAQLFESLFVFENYPVERDADAALRFELKRAEERINYPLGVVVTVEDGLRVTIQYDTGRFDRETVERMLGHLHGVCSQLAGKPEMRVGEFTVLTEEERRQILAQGDRDSQEPVVDADFDLSAYAAGATSAEERELLEQLLAEVQGTPPSDPQDHPLTASPATETSDNHE